MDNSINISGQGRVCICALTNLPLPIKHGADYATCTITITSVVDAHIHRPFKTAFGKTTQAV